MLVLGGRTGAAGQDRAGGLIGVDRVGLAAHPTHRSFGADDLTNLDPGLPSGPSEPRAVGAGALDPDDRHNAEVGQEAQGRAVAIWGGGELLVVEISTERVDRGDVDRVGVGVGTADQRGCLKRGRCHDGTAFRVDSG